MGGLLSVVFICGDPMKRRAKNPRCRCYSDRETYLWARREYEALKRDIPTPYSAHDRALMETAEWALERLKQDAGV